MRLLRPASRSHTTMCTGQQDVLEFAVKHTAERLAVAVTLAQPSEPPTLPLAVHSSNSIRMRARTDGSSPAAVFEGPNALTTEEEVLSIPLDSLICIHSKHVDSAAWAALGQVKVTTWGTAPHTTPWVSSRGRVCAGLGPRHNASDAPAARTSERRGFALGGLPAGKAQLRGDTSQQ